MLDEHASEEEGIHKEGIGGRCRGGLISHITVPSLGVWVGFFSFLGEGGGEEERGEMPICMTQYSVSMRQS
ncbi:hypothetical protein [Candidatus Similichlamydia laticola]|uniref:hypothetical protein n=1 Tax=Candidatus Similichlamydia laticola TaxID=2170265 RepID=UPI000DF722A4|nr:hypothetical protein [Candidatus Similichlamydia laticola]